MNIAEWFKKHWAELVSAPPQKAILAAPLSPELAAVMTDEAGKQIREAFPQIIRYHDIYWILSNFTHNVGKTLIAEYRFVTGESSVSSHISIIIMGKWRSSITVGPHNYSFWYSRRSRKTVSDREHGMSISILTIKYKVEKVMSSEGTEVKGGDTSTYRLPFTSPKSEADSGRVEAEA